MEYKINFISRCRWIFEIKPCGIFSCVRCSHGINGKEPKKGKKEKKTNRIRVFTFWNNSNTSIASLISPSGVPTFRLNLFEICDSVLRYGLNTKACRDYLYYNFPNLPISIFGKLLVLLPILKPEESRHDAI